MRAVIYRQSGETDVLELVDRGEPIPGAGEVLIRVEVSGVNPPTLAADCENSF